MSDSSVPSVSGRTWSRRAVAGLVLLVATTASMVSIYAGPDPRWRACQDALARVGDAAVVSTCRPLNMTDAPVILALLLILLLLAPELKTIKIGGLVEIERNLRETRAEVKEVATQVGALIASASAEARNETNIYLDREVLNQPDAALDEAARAFVKAPLPQSLSEDAKRVDLAGDQARLATLLISLVEDLEGIRRRAFGRDRPPLRPAWAWSAGTDGERLRTWWEVFAEEYQAVRAVRNRVAHDEEVALEDLRRAAHLAGRLWVYAYLAVTPVQEGADVRIPDARVRDAMALG